MCHENVYMKSKTFRLFPPLHTVQGRQRALVTVLGKGGIRDQIQMKQRPPLLSSYQCVWAGSGLYWQYIKSRLSATISQVCHT